MRSPVFYVEIPPSLFAPVIKGLADGGLLPAQARVVVEKPLATTSGPHAHWPRSSIGSSTSRSWIGSISRARWVWTGFLTCGSRTS